MHPVCRHPKDQPRYVRYDLANGLWQLRRQCQLCGDLLSGALRKETGPGAFELPRISADERIKEREGALERLAEEQQQKRQHQDALWWSGYGDYLVSPLWAIKRDKVLKRCLGICEGCRERPASEVHHLTYAHVGHRCETGEFLFELVGVCGDCHRQLHGALE